MNQRNSLGYKKIGVFGMAITTITAFISIFYMIIQTHNVIFTFIPIGYLISVVVGLLTIFLQLNESDSTVRKNKRMYWFAHLSLPIFIACSLLSLFSGFLLSNQYDRSVNAVFGLYLSLYAYYFIPLIITAIFSYFLAYLDKIQRKKESETPINLSSTLGTKKANWIRIIILLYSLFLMIISVVFSSMLFFGTVIRIHSITGIFIPNFSLFYIPIFAAGIILFRISARFPNKKMLDGITLIGIITTGLFILPIAAIPSGIQNAESSFLEAFGADWRNRIGPETERYFMKSPVQLGSYYLAEKEPKCTIIKDILFYQGNETIDQGLKLYFDAYIPDEPGVGNYSTLIRIHGGAWILGDKGMGNMLEVNKYFAAQGYVVFDVQYGIYDTGSNNPITPTNTLGNFSIDDMIRHLGEFTKYISIHASEYSANLNSTFISGNSAGGHLALTVGLAIANGSYSALFGTGVKIKGIIPYYPANGLSKNVLPNSDTIFNDGLNFLTNNSPPILIFHGKQDGLVKPEISENIKSAYKQKGITECAIIWWKFSGHAGDLNYFGPYSQIGLYYSERFMYLYR